MNPTNTNEPLNLATNQPTMSAQIDTLLKQPSDIPPVFERQPDSAYSAANETKPKKAWTLILAWIVFIFASLLFLGLGPCSVILTAVAGPVAWVISMSWMPLVYNILIFATPVLLTLAATSLFTTYKKFPTKIRTVLILLSNIIIGLPFTWIVINNIVPMNLIVFAIILGAITLIPLIVLIVFKVLDKKKSISLISSKPINKKANKITLIVSLIVVLIEFGFAIYQLITPLSSLIATYEQAKQLDQAVESAAKSSGSKSSKNLSKMVYAICGGEYNVIYQSVDDTGLFECKNGHDIFSVTDPHKKKTGYSEMAAASYLGTTYDETAAKYFSDTIYLYRNYYLAGTYTDVILLAEGESEAEIIDNYINAIYGYIKEVNSEYTEDVRVSIFYTEKLNTIKSPRDYIILSGAIGLYDWLPHGNGFSGYYFSADDATALREIAENPSLYSSQTRDAIKFHRHISAEISNGKTITLEQLRAILENSFEESL